MQILIIAALPGFAISVALTFAALAYARRRGLLDQPGKRRSHVLPTPRGGGVGIVFAALLAGLPAWYGLGGPKPGIGELASVAVAVAAVALIGWRDDHAPLPVLPRLAVHLGASLLAVALILASSPMTGVRLAWLLPVLVLLMVGSINAHNFMDGIDGILGQQGLFVMAGYAVMAVAIGATGTAGLAVATAAGCLGFLFFNRPPARIFMGDVGSGALGMLIAIVAILVVQWQPAMLWACLILPSAFLVDSGLTLLRRFGGGQRWYTPHRQHLYQWLVRVKWSHARTDVAYMTWNLLVAAPLAWLAWRWPAHGAAFCVVAWLAAAIAWHTGKRACLAAVRRRGLREVA